MTHNADQVFYYDERFMLRRMDYSPFVTGSPLIAHYTYDARIFDGFVFPTRRMIYRRDANGIANQKLRADYHERPLDHNRARVVTPPDPKERRHDPESQGCAVSARGHRSEPRAPSDTRPDRETTGPYAASPAM